MKSSAMAAIALAAMAGMDALGFPPPRKGSNRDHDADVDRSLTPWGQQARQEHSALRQEIADHNAAVDRAKVEKRARKRK